MAKDSFYAVQKGREPGVYRTWGEVQTQVNGFKGAVYKKFDSAAGAEAFANGSGGYGKTAPKPAYSSFNTKADPSFTSFVPVSKYMPESTSTQIKRTLKPGTSYYAVAKGTQPGVYRSWTECQKAIEGYERPSFKKFETLKDAAAFVEKSSSSTSTPSVKPRSSASKFYGVNYADGKSDIFTTWRECQAAVKHQRGVTFKKFDTLSEAKAFTSTAQAPQLSKAQKQRSVEEYLDKRDESLLQKQRELPRKRVFMDGSFMNNRAGYGIFFGANEPKNVAAHIHEDQVDSYVAEVHATRGALKIINDEIEEFEKGERELMDKYTLATDSETAIGLLSKYTLSWGESEFDTRKAGKQLKDAVKYHKRVTDFYNKNSEIFGGHKFEIEWVKGHDGIEGNEAADQLAKQGAMSTS